LRVFKTKVFSKFAKKENISDIALIEAVERAEKGLMQMRNKLIFLLWNSPYAPKLI